ncbi:hypothetical protein RIF25_06680 [Thermosynechococcaceae cyanobacterium BACA0444]|uniref:Uncharacterized protein n=1 Tax=Pseudocalidococcus azoricus BACA0444 TaxID=2918990 RepID=A0AAE4FSG2_9CYAN|nr:hypothetical protein [Pseudocalidococcus azoricus]MDS3860492.1 hypothetical protein [Pseudocalidococcus azoricus BACA0444]
MSESQVSTASPEENSQAPRKRYKTPKLEFFGNLHSLTQAISIVDVFRGRTAAS